MSARPNAANTPTTKRWVAIEGPCCAGKTTLSRGLLVQLTEITVSHVRCYADHAGGGRFLPRPVPETVAEDEEAVRALLEVEADRAAAARSDPADLVLMDRSVYTLLAHRHALERVTGLSCLATAECIIARSAAPAWPDLVIYLDVSQRTILDRNRRKFPPGSIFIDPTFNDGIRDFYTHATDREPARIVWLDGTLDPTKLVSLAEAHIAELLHRRDT